MSNESIPPLQAPPPISGIHLGAVILQTKKLGTKEVDCYFKQLVCGVEYLHGIDIVCRDLRPESLLMTRDGLLKICNSTSSELCDAGKKSSKKCGSIEYLVLEIFVDTTFDAKSVDIWAVERIYLVMKTGKLPWGLAAEGADKGYNRHLVERESLWGYRPIENLSDVNPLRYFGVG